MTVKVIQPYRLMGTVQLHVCLPSRTSTGMIDPPLCTTWEIYIQIQNRNTGKHRNSCVPCGALLHPVHIYIYEGT